MPVIRPIRRLLVANRGEIACRIARSCRSMGIEVVAICSTADRHSPHLALADIAVEIGPAAAAESYLDIDKIVDAALRTNADAVHPGYGFLAENAAFARAVIDAGLIFVGPPPEVIAALGAKTDAAAVAERVGLPCIPRFDPGQLDRLELPVLVKASAGGGGKGMHVVRERDELADAVASTRRLAAASFGDDTIIVEAYLERARHIEVQILGDQHGNVIALGERECSIQRRHQKVLEETPAPHLDAELRDKMTSAAVALGREVGYQNAGTVEMILAPDGRFFFLEVNTRLQVEHAVTEMTTGIDLVREQIRIAEGHPISLAGVVPTGAAIEARLYAEDPSAGDLPAAGTVLRFVAPTGDGIRVDAALAAGMELGIDYDPMIAKVIAAGADRHEALCRLRRALSDLRLDGVRTNRTALLRLLDDPMVIAGTLDTQLWDRHRDVISAPAPDLPWAAVAATLADVEQRRRSRRLLPAVAPGFRLSPLDSRVAYTSAASDDELVVSYRMSVGGASVRCGDIDTTVRIELDEHAAVLSLWDAAGLRRRFGVTRDGARVHVHTASGDHVLAQVPRFPDADAATDSDTLTAPMPGRVASLRVAVGQTVARGETLLVLEAMKMEHPVLAPHAGEVTEIAAREGQQVDADQVLAVVRAAEEPAETPAKAP